MEGFGLVRNWLASSKGSGLFAWLSALILVTASAPWVTPYGTAGEQAAVRPRIVSLYAGHTEVLLRLGARDHLVGIARQDSYAGPETAGWSVPEFSLRDDVEKFLAAGADLVLARPRQLAGAGRLCEALEKMGIKVLAPQAVGKEDLYDYWRELARLVGREEAAEKMIADFSRKIAVFSQSAAKLGKRPGIFIEAVHREVMTFAPDSFPAWLVGLAGGRYLVNAAEVSGGGAGLLIPYGPERLLSHADEVDIFLSEEGVMNRTGLQEILARPVYQPLHAFRTANVHKIPEEYIARPTPSLLDGLELISGYVREWANAE